MKDLLIKIAGIVGTIVFATLWLNDCAGHKKEVSALELEVTEWQESYDSCKAAKVYTEESWEIIDKILGKVFIPVPVDSTWVGIDVNDTNWIKVEMVDSVWVAEVKEATYQDTIKTDDFELFWMAKVQGRLVDGIKVPYYRVFQKTVTESHVIEKPVYKYSYVYKSRLDCYFMLGTDDFTGVRGFDIGLDYSNKKGWGLLGGYQRLIGDNYFKAGVKLRIL